MVTRPRIRSLLAAIALYTMAGLLIGYFWINAYSGNHGLKARESLDQQIANLQRDLVQSKAERERWQRRVDLLKSDRIDPDMLDERARLLLDYADPRDAVLLVRKP